MVSFGSGAGSDAFDLRVADKLLERRDKALKTQDYIARRTEIDLCHVFPHARNIAMK